MPSSHEKRSNDWSRATLETRYDDLVEAYQALVHHANEDQGPNSDPQTEGLHNRVDRPNSDIDSNKSRLDSSDEDLARNIIELEKEIEQLRSEHEEIQDRDHDLENEKNMLLKDNIELSEFNEGLYASKKDLVNRYQSLKDTNRELEERIKHLEDMETEMAREHEEIKNRNQEYQDSAASDAKVDSEDGNQDIISQLILQNEFLTAQVKDFEASAGSSQDQIRIMSEEIERLEGRREQTMVECQEGVPQDDNADLNNVPSPLFDPPPVSRCDADVPVEANNQVTEREEAKDALEPEQSQHISPNGSNGSLLQPLGRTEKLEIVDEKLEECNEERQKLTNEIQSQRRSIAQMQEEISRLEDALEDTNNDKLEWETKYEALQSEHISNNHDWSERYEALKEQREALQAECHEMQVDYDYVKGRCEDLDAELAYRVAHGNAKNSGPQDDDMEGVTGLCAEKCKEWEQRYLAEAGISSEELGKCNADWQRQYDNLERAFASLKRTHSKCAIKSPSQSASTSEPSETCEEKCRDWEEKYNTLCTDYGNLKARINPYELDNQLEVALAKCERYEADRDTWRAKYNTLLAERGSDAASPDTTGSPSTSPANLADLEATLAAALEKRDAWEAQHAVAIVEKDEWVGRYNRAIAERNYANRQIDTLEEQLTEIQGNLEAAQLGGQEMANKRAAAESNCDDLNRVWMEKYRLLRDEHKVLQEQCSAILDNALDVAAQKQNFEESVAMWKGKYDKLQDKFWGLVGQTVRSGDEEKKVEEVERAWTEKYKRLVGRSVELARESQMERDVLAALLKMMFMEAEAKAKAEAGSGEKKDGGVGEISGKGNEACKKKCKKWEAKNTEAEERYENLITSWTELRGRNFELLEEVGQQRVVVERFNELVDALMHSMRTE
ncbi:hypothetical protein NX059_011932 [Plenodomus lindquistii]|nr:hypothetical protein NX059_011932 [Plenodomus lindquistii]